MFSQAYKRYALGTLTILYLMNYVDRNVFGVVMQSIKEDLLLSDTQLGFLTGIAFALFYSTLGIPIARWADRGNRVSIASLAMALWSVMVMLSSLVTNFSQLALVRIGAAVGEAGCMPPGYSLLGDYFRGRERTRAMTIYTMGAPLSAIVGLVVAGWLNDLYGWRVTFLLVGIPGLLIAALVKLTIAEPRLGGGRPLANEQRVPSLRDVLMTVWQQRSFRHLMIAQTLLMIVGVGFAPWVAAFMIRSHGMTSSEVGVWLGLIVSVCGVMGILFGGYLADRYLAGREDAQMRVVAVTVALLLPLFAIFLLVPQKYLLFISLVSWVPMFYVFCGPVYALMQRLVVSEMRATALAVVLLVSNLVGMGIGPQAVGILSDLWMPVFGTDSLRMAMLAVSLVVLWSAYHFWIVGRTVKADVSAVQMRDEAAHSPITDDVLLGSSVVLRKPVYGSQEKAL